MSWEDLNEDEHNMWKYVYLMAHLRAKPRDEYTGAESHINEAIEEGDISWMPEKISWRMQLNNIGAEEEETDDVMQEEQRQFIASSKDEFSALRSEMVTLKRILGNLEKSIQEIKEKADD